MDPAHGPFVHQAWWWRSAASIHEKTKHFEPIPQGFRMSSHAPSANSAPYKLLGVYGEPITTTIDFVLPNRRFETIRAGEKWFASLTTVTPVTPSTCRIDVAAAWNVFYNIPFVTPIAKFFGNRFVRQDQQTMIEQAQGLRSAPPSCSSTTPTSPPNGTSPSNKPASPTPKPTPSQAQSPCTGVADYPAAAPPAAPPPHPSSTHRQTAQS